MRHLLLFLAIGCGGDTSGEPIAGTVTLMYGEDAPKLVVGAAVEQIDAPGRMLVQLGTDDVDCGTNFEDPDTRLSRGSFVFFDLDKAVATTSLRVSVLHVTSSSLHLNSATGSVTIETIEPRVTGNVAFMTTDDDVGPIFVAGTFDVIRCF